MADSKAKFIETIDVVVERVIGLSRSEVQLEISVSGYDPVESVTFSGNYPTLLVNDPIRVEIFTGSFDYEGSKGSLRWFEGDIKKTEKALTISLLDPEGNVVSGPYHSSDEFR